MGAIKPGGGGASGTVADGSVTAAKLAANAVTLAKVDTTTVTAAALGAAYPTAGALSARPAASTGIIGQLYTDTDVGVVYACLSDGSGGALWRMWGRVGVEGLDTTCVALNSWNARALGNASVAAATAVSGAVIFAESSTPSGVGIITIFGPHQLEIGLASGDRHQISLYVTGVGTSRVTLGTISASPTTRHCIAWKTVGFTTTWSLDGGAAATASHVSGAPSGTTALTMSSGSFPANVYLTAVKVWATALADADLATVSAAYASGRIPDVSGATKTIDWHASLYTAGALGQQLYGGTAAGAALTWSNAFPLTSRAS